MDNKDLKRIFEIFELNGKRVRKLTINIPYDGLVTIDVERIVIDTELNQVTPIFEKYKLIPND